MRILFLSVFHPYGEYDVGAGNHLRNLAEQLENLGCDIHILMPGSKNQTVEKNGLLLHFFKTPSLKSFGKDIFFPLFSVGMINKLCQQYNIDIVHGQSPSSFAYKALSPVKKPYVVTLHGTSFGEMTSCFSVPIFDINIRLLRDAIFIQPLDAALTGIEYAKADKVIGVSRYITKEAMGFYHIPKDKIIPIHNGVNLPADQVTSGGQSNPNVILCVGRLIWRKGIRHLIESMPAVLKEYADTKLFIVGTGEQKPSLKNLTRHLGIENSVQFLGNVSNEKLISLYSEATIYVQPSLYEPLGITILEAMSFRKPVIASRVGGIPEIITDEVDGLLVEPENTQQLEKSIIGLFSDPAIRSKYGKNARKKIELNFTWNKIATQTLDVYKDLFEEKTLDN